MVPGIRRPCHGRRGNHVRRTGLVDIETRSVVRAQKRPPVSGSGAFRPIVLPDDLPFVPASVPRGSRRPIHPGFESEITGNGADGFQGVLNLERVARSVKIEARTSEFRFRRRNPRVAQGFQVAFRCRIENSGARIVQK